MSKLIWIAGGTIAALILMGACFAVLDRGSASDEYRTAPPLSSATVVNQQANPLGDFSLGGVNPPAAPGANPASAVIPPARPANPPANPPAAPPANPLGQPDMNPLGNQQ